jgi:hypothetical protein
MSSSTTKNKILIVLLCIGSFVILFKYLSNVNKEEFTTNIFQPIKELEVSTNNSLMPYLEKIRGFKEPKMNCYQENKIDNKQIVFNNTKNQNTRNKRLNKMNKTYFTLDDDALNKSLLPRNNALFII